MVFFTCNSCGTALKKNQVERHMGSCGHVVSCIDCLKDFRGQEFQSHTKCISEAEKYNGPDWKAPSSQNKGERKQLQWVETVNNALEKGRQDMTPSQIALMKLIFKHDNVPRKKPKFMNFIKNVAKNSFDTRTVEAVWNYIETEWKSQAEQNKPPAQATTESAKNGDDSKTNGNEQNGHSEENGHDAPSKKSKKEKKRKREVTDDAGNEEGEVKKKKGESNENGTNGTESQDETVVEALADSTGCEFRWGEVIQNILLSRDDHSITMKKLKKKVFAEYYARVGDSKGVKTKEDLTAQLNKKLKKKKFNLIGETVKLAAANSE